MARGGVYLFCVDNNKARQSELEKVYAPSKILEEPDAIIVILCHPVKEVKDQLLRMGIKNHIVVYPFWGFGHPIDLAVNSSLHPAFDRVQYIEKHLKELKELYDLEDKETRTVFWESIAQRKKKCMDFMNVDIAAKLSQYNALPYFYDEELAPNGELTLIDGGAFDGDTIYSFYKKFGNRVKKIYAFEPDKNNLNRMKENIRDLGRHISIEYIEGGMGETDGKLKFCSNRDIRSGFSDEGDEEISVFRIDSVVDDVIGTLCIKMDIEGFELNALKGASKTIKEYHPYMVICIYHKYTDFYEIPHYLKGLYEGYKFYLRCGFHSELYAVPEKVK